MNNGRLGGKALRGVGHGHGTRARRGRPLVRTACPNSEPGDGEDHEYGHEREIDRDPQSARTSEVHKSPSAPPQSGLTRPQNALNDAR